jgi:hypothetical protein
MMHKLFSMVWPTELIIDYRYSGFCNSDKGSVTLYDIEGLALVYKSINACYLADRNYLAGRKDDFKPIVNIIMNGKLNKKNINITFNDIESFRTYLIDNALMPESKPVHEIKLGS